VEANNDVREGLSFTRVLVIHAGIDEVTLLQGRDTPLWVPLTRDTSQGLLRELTDRVGAVLPRITRLLEQEDMSESVVIQAAYIGLGPFFSEPSSGNSSAKGKNREVFGAAGMKALRLSALGLIRTVSSRIRK
jgi:hypothetical protein